LPLKLAVAAKDSSAFYQQYDSHEVEVRRV